MNAGGGEGAILYAKKRRNLIEWAGKRVARTKRNEREGKEERWDVMGGINRSGVKLVGRV